MYFSIFWLWTAWLNGSPEWFSYQPVLDAGLAIIKQEFITTKSLSSLPLTRDFVEKEGGVNVFSCILVSPENWPHDYKGSSYWSLTERFQMWVLPKSNKNSINDKMSFPFHLKRTESFMDQLTYRSRLLVKIKLLIRELLQTWLSVYSLSMLSN